MQAAWCSVETTAPAKMRQSPIFSISRATALGALKENDNRKKRRSPVSMTRPKSTKNNVQTKT
jgi:hypothetical protein